MKKCPIIALAAGLLLAFHPRAALAAAPEASPLDAAEQAYNKLLESDDAAQNEVDQWIQDAQKFDEAGAPWSNATLTARIEQRLAEVDRAYREFLDRHPDHARARLAYGSFLYDTREPEKAREQWEQARQSDPKNPAAWNNLANYYGHFGPVTNSFVYYEKAIELRPDEPVYYQNLAVTTYLFRKDAKEHYGFTEAQVFDRALDLYRKALKLDPDNFTLATDYAQSYYGIKPLRAEEAIEAWNGALKIANDDIERQGVQTHLARVKLNSGRFDEARAHLKKVDHEMYDALKDRLLRNLESKEKAARAESSPESVDLPPSR